MKKQYYYIIGIFVVVIGFLGFYFYNKQEKEQVKQPTINEKSCKEADGELVGNGPSDTWRCNLPTSDAGKECSNQSDCEGSCIVDLEDNSRVTDKHEIIYTKGQCTSWMITLGCNAYVEEGKVSNISCFD